MRRSATIAMLLLVLALALWAVPVLAQNFDLAKGIVGNLNPTCAQSGDCGFCDFIDLFIVLQKVILSLFGGLALVMLVWGGQGIITAAGNSQKVAEARKLILSTLFGVVIIMAGYFLINVVVFILVTPGVDQGTGKPKEPTSTIFKSFTSGGDAWRRAFCSDPSASNFCAERGDDTPCTAGQNPGICRGGQCIELCADTLGAGASCQSIYNAACGTTGDTLTKRRATCTQPHCQLNLCGGAEDNECCKP